MHVLFAPDYRKGNPYQALLAGALESVGIKVEFLSDYYRGLPLFRGVRAHRPDIVHLHWPEQYFQQRSDGLTALRVARYPLDFWLSARYRPVVLTAHNLFPHDRAAERGIVRNVRFSVQRAAAIFAHSKAAKRELCSKFEVPVERVHVIPFGDHAQCIGPPMPRSAARNRLGIPADIKLCLVFGTVSPYKGTDEVVRFWAQAGPPYDLAVVGPVLSEEFARRLHGIARGNRRIDLRLSGEWLDDDTLHTWLSAADCAIFNYRDIFSSGAAALARSRGLPIVFPSRLTSVDLDEPHPLVYRFRSMETDFLAQLSSAMNVAPNYELAAEWRKKTKWQRVAYRTAQIYQAVLRRGLETETP